MIYEVGKFYTVQVAIIYSFQYGGFPANGPIPLLGELHEDKEIIRFEHDHYHIDWRFASNRAFEYYNDGIFDPGNEFATVVVNEHIAKIETRRLKCKRDFRQYPSKRAFWMPELEAKYSTAIAKKGRCPHKGVDLSTIKPDSDGCVTCPLHGLRWNASTWKLQPITEG